jgi:hypothetical protein
VTVKGIKKVTSQTTGYEAFFKEAMNFEVKNLPCSNLRTEQVKEYCQTNKVQQ